MAPDPAERLPSADHLRRGLEALLAAHPERRGDESLFAGVYDRLELLGVGASASVTRGFDRLCDREVAIKVLRHDRPDPDDEIRFERAAKILAHLVHPNVPAVLHTGVHHGQRFLVTALCPGVPASEYTQGRRRLQPREVIQLGLQLVSVLGAIHTAGVIYRDLHPGNVLIDPQREPKAWLFDFDYSQVTDVFWARLPQRWATPPERRREPTREKPLRTMDYAAPRSAPASLSPRRSASRSGTRSAGRCPE